ncbi:MAG: hypothetical protein JNK37_07820 [Verrucomicrobiales bacterium]|nr:hypothetical protein [Verrucomicrobiales bacterium]
MSSSQNSASLWHQLGMSEVVQLLQTDCQRGLDAAEVFRRQNEHGLNVVTARGGTPASSPSS